MQTVNKTMVGRPDPAAMHWESLSDIGDDFNHDDFDDAPARRSQSLGRLDAKQCAETTDADQQDWSVHGCAPAVEPIGTDNSRELHPTTPPNSTSSPPTPETPVTIDDFADEVDSRTGRLFIGGLSWESTANDLRDYFVQFGALESCHVVRKSHSGKSRGFGFITYVDPADAEQVIKNDAMLEYTLDGRRVEPKVALPESSKSCETSEHILECWVECWKSQAGTHTPRQYTNVTPSRAGRVVFVGGLPWASTVGSVSACFKQFGIIEKVVLIRERQSQRLRGFGFITFTKDTSATALVAQRFVECNNQMTECRRAKGKAAFTRQDSAASEEDPFHYRRGPEHLSHGIEYHTSEPSGEWSTMEDTYSDDAGYATDAPFAFVHPGTHPSYQHGFRRIESPPMGHFVPSFGHPMADHGSPMLSHGAECHTIGGYPAGIHNQSYQYPQSHFLDYRHAPAQPFQFVQMMPFRPCYHPMLGQGPQDGC